MKLTDHERSMLDGAQGRAKARAMDLPVRYGDALGAERLVKSKLKILPTANDRPA
jgi:predicted aconitase